MLFVEQLAALLCFHVEGIVLLAYLFHPTQNLRIQIRELRSNLLTKMQFFLAGLVCRQTKFLLVL